MKCGPLTLDAHSVRSRIAARPVLLHCLRRRVDSIVALYNTGSHALLTSRRNEAESEQKNGADEERDRGETRGRNEGGSPKSVVKTDQWVLRNSLQAHHRDVERHAK